MKKLFSFIADFFRIDGYSSATRLIFIFGSFWLMIVCTGMLFYLKENALIVGTFFLTIEGVLTTLKLYQNSQENKTNEK